MNTERAEELIEQGSGKNEWVNNSLLLGLQILAKYVDNVDNDAAFEHDVMWAGGSFEEIITRMTEEDIIEMGRLRWGHDEENDSWMHF